MEEDEQIMYLHALDFRIAQYEERVEHAERNSGKPLVSIAGKKVNWDDERCPLCIWSAMMEYGDLECQKCPASQDEFCTKFVQMEDTMTMSQMQDSPNIREMEKEMLQVLKDQRARVERRQPLGSR